jgi:chromosome segregation ATPase
VVVARTRSKKSAGDPQGSEEELGDIRGRLTKIERELSQAFKQTQAQETDLHKLATSVAASNSTVTALAGLNEELRQVRELIGRMQERHGDLANQTEKLDRERQAEAGRERHERGALAKQTDALASSVQAYESRIQALEEMSHHVEEEIAGIRLADQAFSRDLGETSSQAARGVDASIRLEHELNRLTVSIDALQKEDETLAERLNLLVEQVGRLGGRIDKLEALTAFTEEAKDRFNRSAFEREQLGERITAVERIAAETPERVQEVVQGLALLEQQGHHQNTKLLAMAEQLQQIGEDTRGQIKKLVKGFLRQRGRQVDALNQEIKELKQSDLSPD